MTAGTAEVVEVSVIVVLADVDDTATTLDAVTAAMPPSTEVMIVESAGGGVDFDAARWPSVRVVTANEGAAFATAANLAAATAVGSVLCFVTPGTTVTDDWLAPLSAALGDESVACAVPMVIGPDGRVVEAGRVAGRGGAVVAIGAGEDASSLAHQFPRRSAGGSVACVAVRRSSFVNAGGFDPEACDLLEAGTSLAGTLRDAGLGTVYEPASRVVFHEPEPPLGAADGVPVLRDAECHDRILVVAGFVPSPTGPWRDRRLLQLLLDLVALVPEGRLTLLAMDGHGSARTAPLLLRQGIEIVVGPQDWDLWLRRRSLSFSHVVMTDLPSHRRIAASLRATQPQACRVLCLPSLHLPSGSAVDPDDEAGLRLFGRHVQEQVAQAARDAHAAWCATEQDRTWLVAAAPHVPCSVIPTAAGVAHDMPFASRSGYVALAIPGADAGAGHDDAALHAARVVLPTLLARDPTAFLRVVVDDPAPALQLLAGPAVELVPAGQDPTRWLRRSRVCLAWYPRGNGSRTAIELALDARTPLVTSPAALDDAGLGCLGELAATGDASSMSLLAERLHNQDGLWHEVHAELVRLAEGPRAAASTRLKLLRACADIGIAPRPGFPLDEPLAPPDPEPELALRPRNVSVVGSAWKAAPAMPDGPLPPAPASGDDAVTAAAVNDQYQRWHARYGPTERRLATLSRRLSGLVRRPTISIVMPVFNTEPAWLHDAISSVRSQVYPHWELCMADDGSVVPGTLEVLETHLGEEPRIRLVRLPEQQGIVGASNAALALATGQFVGFLDHDDELKPHALGEIALALDDQPTLDLLYSDEDKRDPDGRLVDPFFKPDWSPDHLTSRNYVCHFLVVRRSLLEKLGGFRSGYDGSQDYDLVLRATELTDRIAHISEPLYTWRKVAGSTASHGDAKPWALDSARRALKDALARRGTPGEVVDGLHPTTYRVRYALRGNPKVSILIPTRDRVDLLRGCIESIQETTTYTNYEIMVVDNGSIDPETLGYLAAHPGPVVRYPHGFNYARLVNLGASHASGDLLLFLNNDTKVVTPGWLEAMVEHGQRPEVGVVGARLLYPNGHVQHEGIIVGHKGGHAGNIDHGGFWGLGQIVRNCSSVTGACMLIRPSVYWSVGGHEERLRVAYNDVDICLRIRQAGYDVVYTPYAELVHVEGGTRGIHAHVDDDDFFEARWVSHKCLDPYYSPNFERLSPFQLRT